MAMAPGVRKFALTAHVASSVGWLGSVAVFLVLAVVGLTSENTPQAQGAYMAMQLTGWYVIVPLAFASLLTGLVQSLGTTWGLLRHYWVLAKLTLTVVATFLLLLHMQVADHVADAAVRANLSGTDLDGMRVQLVADAAAAVLVLLTTTALSIYKPRGITRYGWRVQNEQRAERAGERAGDGDMGTAAAARA
ncbi:hypothetical protein [Streptomyces himalayensis]|uniref:DUF2269 domain-containing protein n=1 Tax=Streptomyces himalayensis subsp. himalayensis TaxID=2756131 RepID=A0A7W0DPH4_9ACTN|nr:hypothetical protein [Streptomyces himalayensis]MBA2948897.1 hypothetical protein [Streptomyces himalayensis subsp. himalayensis]